MWDWPVWSALIVATGAEIGALVVLARRGRETWRAVKDVRVSAAGALGEFGAKAAQTAEKAAEAADTEELQESVARLRRSLAQLAVLQKALDEARI